MRTRGTPLAALPRAVALTPAARPPVYLPSQPKQPVEFDQAISYVNKIKKRFAVRLPATGASGQHTVTHHKPDTHTRRLLALPCAPHTLTDQ